MDGGVHAPAAVVTRQPGAPPTPPGAPVSQWMGAPAQHADPTVCPPGLEYLTMVNQVLAHQVIELLQAFTGWETNNKYAIKNSMGQQIYYAFEDTDCCMRMCCGPNREFTIHIVDNYNCEVMRIYRPLKVCAGCCWCADACRCCAQELAVEAPPGRLIGRVLQAATVCGYDFCVQDASGATQLLIVGPVIMFRCCADVEFPIYTADRRHQIGAVTKQWGGLVREMYTQADHFGISFPMDLEVKMKATLLGAMFLIDFMAFEKKQN